MILSDVKARELNGSGLCLYICLVPVFALIYWWLPDGQFRVPDGGATDFSSWLYYSIVTITTLGFGDKSRAGAYSRADALRED